MMMSLLERLNHAFSGGIMFVQPTAETNVINANSYLKRSLCHFLNGITILTLLYSYVFTRKLRRTNKIANSSTH